MAVFGLGGHNRDGTPPHLLEELRDDAELARREIAHGRFQRSMALVTAFSAAVSGFEAYTQHQRGAFNDRWMWTPVWLAPPTVAAAGAALTSARAARRVLPAVSLVSLVDGLLGFVYHLRGIKRLPGGFRAGQYNIAMGPPVFAPLLLCSVGTMGVFAGLLRRERPAERTPLARARGALAARLPGSHEEPPVDLPFARRVAQGRFQQAMAITVAGFAVIAGGEAYFEHLRGSFNQRVMWTPILVTPPMAAAAVGAAASGRVARWVLPFAAAAAFLDGLLGFCLHLRGIKRMPGQFGNLRFNMTMGPPLFAPLLFTSVGLMGFIAALLRRREGRS
ncbi:MAG TPA: hypothetical protein VKV26_02260 [Dehalococcoidia bacterium]|nr:hypothetical protein [Dehalococcoidia bacterium]